MFDSLTLAPTICNGFTVNRPMNHDIMNSMCRGQSRNACNHSGGAISIRIYIESNFDGIVKLKWFQIVMSNQRIIKWSMHLRFIDDAKLSWLSTKEFAQRSCIERAQILLNTAISQLGVSNIRLSTTVRPIDSHNVSRYSICQFVAVQSVFSSQ